MTLIQCTIAHTTHILVATAIKRTMSSIQGGTDEGKKRTLFTKKIRTSMSILCNNIIVIIYN